MTFSDYEAAYPAIDAQWHAARASGDVAAIDAAKVAYRDWCRASSEAMRAAEAARDKQRAERHAELRAEIERRNHG